jgi:phosphatidate cytidylyltransferase
MLITRVKTSLLLVLCIVVMVWWAPAAVRAGFFALMGLWATLEWSRLIGSTRATRAMFCVAVLGGVVSASLAATLGVPLMWWLQAAVAFWLWMLALLLTQPTNVSAWIKWLGGLGVLIPAALSVFMLLTELPTPKGGFMLLLVWAVVAAADVGAYFAGRAFGRHKLAPLISPGKTWEGVLGGALFALAVAQVGAYLLALSALSTALLAAVVIAASVVGDLTESLFKRHAGVKDSGSVLPGHGGILDRVDGLVAALPLYVVGLHLLNLWH